MSFIPLSALSQQGGGGGLTGRGEEEKEERVERLYRDIKAMQLILCEKEGVKVYTGGEH